jgi:hypothetical protein
MRDVQVCFEIVMWRTCVYGDRHVKYVQVYMETGMQSMCK